jgi:hypothetical protein
MRENVLFLKRPEKDAKDAEFNAMIEGLLGPGLGARPPSEPMRDQ